MTAPHWLHSAGPYTDHLCFFPSPAERQGIDCLNESQYIRQNDVAVTFRATMLLAAQTDAARYYSTRISNQIQLSVQFSCCQEEGDPVTMNVSTDKFSPTAPYCDIIQELYWTHKSTHEQLAPQCYTVRLSNSKLHAYHTTQVLLKLLSCVPLSQ